MHTWGVWGVTEGLKHINKQLSWTEVHHLTSSNASEEVRPLSTNRDGCQHVCSDTKAKFKASGLVTMAIISYGTQLQPLSHKGSVTGDRMWADASTYSRDLHLPVWSNGSCNLKNVMEFPHQMSSFYFHTESCHKISGVEKMSYIGQIWHILKHI